ncbi:MAG: elongation factor P [Dehalococcoidia bacterium]|nr:elongation factor P [Dehalococcoidia bacterium]
MIDAGGLRKGIAIELDGKIYQIIEYRHIKIGRGSAQVRLRLRDIRSGNTVERSFQASDKFTPAFLEHRHAQCLYNDSGIYYFMDSESYEQTSLTTEQLGEAKNYLKEGLELELLTYKGTPISVELPAAVELRVIETEPGFKGDTATGGSKLAKLETGINVQVPLFIDTGEIIKVDTRTGEYLGKAG